ncbi:MAG: alpha/beta hydrolase [Cyanobacteria bacterium P01_H01_bin.119]
MEFFIKEWGSGEPSLIFLHYFSGAAESWRWVIEQLTPDFRCVAIDLPGFGQAPPLANPSLAAYGDYIGNALKQLEIKNGILVGHSMGGKLALQVATTPRLAALLSQVILVAPSPPTQEPMPDQEKQRLLNQHPSRESAVTTVESATQRSLPDDRRALAIETYRQAENSAWRWWLQTGMNHSIADQTAQIEIPVTVIASQDDPVIPLQMLEHDFGELLPQTKIIALSEIGHLIPLEAPEALSAEIRRLIA